MNNNEDFDWLSPQFEHNPSVKNPFSFFADFNKSKSQSPLSNNSKQ